MARMDDRGPWPHERPGDGAVRRMRRGRLFELSVARLFVYLAISSFTAMVLCVNLILKNHFGMATNVMCVYEFVSDKDTATNYLPIVSTSAGYHQPNRAIWSFLIGVTGLPRVIQLLVYHAHFLPRCRPYLALPDTERVTRRRRVTRWAVRALLYLTPAAGALEYLVGLQGLTAIPTLDNFPLHEGLTQVFTLSGIAHLYLHCILVYVTTCCPVTFTLTELKGKLRAMMAQRWLVPWSLKLKLLLATIVLIDSLLALASYILHSRFCWEGVYTMFAVAEYVTITVTILFHLTICIDFSRYQFVVAASTKVRTLSGGGGACNGEHDQHNTAQHGHETTSEKSS